MSDLPQSGAVLVRRALLSDVLYIDSLRRSESESIGFLPLACYESCISGHGADGRPNHRVLIAEANGDRVGFCYASPGAPGRPARVIQICIQPDARRIEYGRALIERVEGWAAAGQRSAVGCRVATDIEAGSFWDTLGYRVVGHLAGGTRRQRVLESRYRLLDCGLWSPVEVA